ncbi:Bacterial transcription activator, effector binding domain [Thalassoglobus neptunius]|uniref:Bacterial transcription activator, effector binding domain n=1 Tax=Thalassoglobus neptunius TaxID=1938619 RepID=A0A5C5X337_9PLAN|nr:GyrI-like domain-containing protein [Thalassoglobus neptunius]TWT57497.1 Bacterial transcription activator, effector binding domain [Thalassoglobus neptunius]
MPSYQVSRSINIDAPPEEVYDKVVDYSTWTIWSPWLCAEPGARVTVSDDSTSVGSTYAWSGEIVGAGELEHLSLEPGQLIEDEIRFIKPFKSVSEVRFLFTPTSGGTEVTWQMNGSLPWFLFWMKSSLELYIGMDYERGLMMLKEWIETGTVESQTKIRGIESVGPLTVYGIRNKCSFDDVGPSMEEAISESKQRLEDSSIPIVSGPLSVYHEMDLKRRTFDFTSGFVVSSSARLPEGMSNWGLPPCKALAVEHQGPYRHLGNAWSAAHQFARYKKLKQNKCGGYEIYLNDPCNTESADIRTDIYLPLK